MKKLFIIGNGFDIAHKLPTKFNFDFKKIAERNEKYTHFWKFYQSENLDMWSDFENALGHPNFNTLERIFDGYEPNFGSDDESDRDAIILQIKISGNLSKSLYEFAVNADNSIDSCKIILEFNKMFNSECYFINFNYTHTLEKLYGIKDNKIIHIHGEAGNENLILGYPEGSFNPEKYKYDFRHKGRGPYAELEIEEFIKLMEGNDEFDSYTYQAFKMLLDKTKTFSKKPQLEQLSGFLNNNNFEEIVVIGHSCKIDFAYFKFLNDKYKNVLWRFWAYGESDKDNILKLIDKVKISNYKIERYKSQFI